MSTREPPRTNCKRQQGWGDGEIDLRELVNVLQRQRTFIVSVVAIAVVASVALAFLMPKVYQAEVMLNPPISKDVEMLQVYYVIHDTDTPKGSSTIKYLYEIEQKDIYNKFIRFLKSKAVQYDFFKKNKLVEVLRDDKYAGLTERDIFEKIFSDRITIIDNRGKSRQELDTITIQLRGESEAMVVSLLNNYVSFVDEYTVKTIVDAIEVKIDLNKKMLKYQTDSLRSVGHLRRFDKIAVLSEALMIAGRIGLSDQINVPLISAVDSTDGNQDVKIKMAANPLYLRGAKALQAEIDVLKARKNDDPFISQLRNLQQRFSVLSDMGGIVEEGLHTININKPAIETGNPVKPKRKIIVLMGVLLGGIIAFPFAFIRDWLNGDSIVSTVASKM